MIDFVNTKQIISFFDEKEEHMKEAYCNGFSRNKFSEFLTQMGWTYTEYKELRQPIQNSSKFHICLEFNFSSNFS